MATTDKNILTNQDLFAAGTHDRGDRKLINDKDRDNNKEECIQQSPILKINEREELFKIKKQLYIFRNNKFIVKDDIATAIPLTDAEEREILNEVDLELIEKRLLIEFQEKIEAHKKTRIEAVQAVARICIGRIVMVKSILSEKNQRNGWP